MSLLLGTLGGRVGTTRPPCNQYCRPQRTEICDGSFTWTILIPCYADVGSRIDIYDVFRVGKPAGLMHGAFNFPQAIIVLGVVCNKRGTSAQAGSPGPFGNRF